MRQSFMQPNSPALKKNKRLSMAVRLENHNKKKKVTFDKNLDITFKSSAIINLSIPNFDDNQVNMVVEKDNRKFR